MNRDDVLGLARAAGFDEDRSIVGERPAQMLSRNEYVAEPVFRHEFIARHIDVLVRFADMVAVRIAAHSPPPPLVVSLSDIDQARLAAMPAKAPAMPLVAAPDDSKLAACFNQIKSDLIADGAVEHDLRLEFFPEAVLDAFRRQRAARQEAQAMAECLDMLRTDLIAAEVIGPDVAPMFLTEAVMAAVSRERTARIEAQQRLADMPELAAKAGLAHRKAEPVAWMWRVADSDWQLESTRPPARPLAIVEPLYTGYMADAYIEAQQRLADLQDLMSKSGLAHRKAVQVAVSEAVAAEREACAEIAADSDHIVDVPGHYAQLGDAKATAHNIEKAIRARGAA